MAEIPNALTLLIRTSQTPHDLYSVLIRHRCLSSSALADRAAVEHEIASTITDYERRNPDPGATLSFELASALIRAGFLNDYARLRFATPRYNPGIDGKLRARIQEFWWRLRYE
jgi:hypothetical protein